MFVPMAETVILALAGATIFSVTFTPAMVALLLGGKVSEKENFVVRPARRVYERLLTWALRHRGLVVSGAVILLGICGLIATRLGSEFVPKLGEGALAIQPARIPSVSLATSVAMRRRAACSATTSSTVCPRVTASTLRAYAPEAPISLRRP